MVGGNRATTCLICPKDFRMSYTSSSIRPPPTLSDPVLSSRNRKDLAPEPQHFHQLYRPQGPLERKRSPARPPLSGRPGQGLAWSPRFVTGQSPWHPHLDAQQRLAVVVCPVLALRVMQLLRLAGASHRGAQ